ncbi:hypothetical protein [Bowmanella yangjiangensis]|uniref:Uncharacterized protein n=1 Tax=Bowmanella yangjiangensis TaxID=2811230 RepID=A0ABS3CNM0_9ALTE|nr:hypothetical protein [Bowmanella yangjiangensis]MBN7818703.1 hypothetical protein [Bowmanella yangjiangensis]
MNKQEILEKISQLEHSARKMNEPEKTFKLSDASKLKIAIEGMSISDIAQKIGSIDLPKIQEIEENISLAKQAKISHSQRVDAFNTVYGIIKDVIGLAI